MTTPFTLPIPTYQCHKRVQALKIKTKTPKPYGYEFVFEDERFPPAKVGKDCAWPALALHDVAHSGGYVVWFDGGDTLSVHAGYYLSGDVFESAYTLADGGSALPAGDAAELARAWHAFAKEWPGGPSEVEAALDSRDAEIERLRHALELAGPVMDAHAGPSRLAEFVSAGRATQAALEVGK